MAGKSIPAYRDAYRILRGSFPCLQDCSPLRTLHKQGLLPVAMIACLLETYSPFVCIHCMLISLDILQEPVLKLPGQQQGKPAVVVAPSAPVELDVIKKVHSRCACLTKA